MKPALFLAVLLALAACDSPSLSFTGVPSQRVEVDGSIFSIRVQFDDAEAIRLSREWPPPRAVVLMRAERAIAQASGCRVAAIDGDRSIQRATLAC